MVGSSFEHPHGSVEQLFVPDWTSMASGDRVSIVVDNVIWGPNTGLGKLIPTGQVVRLSGLLPLEAPGFAKVTLLSAVFLSTGNVLELALDDRSFVHCHQPVSHESLLNLVELCAGAGMSAVGFQKVGFVHRCAVELQPALASLHASVHPGVPVVCADVTTDDCVKKILAVCPEPCMLMAGIACQPYSRGGLQKGEQDQRANTLPGVLRVQYLLQSPLLAIECVAPAQTNAFVQDHIRALEFQFGMLVTQCTLRLENVWAACRYRWWLLASVPGLGRVKIPEFPNHSPMVVRDLMPFVRQWSIDDEQQVALSSHELDKFRLGPATMKQHEVKPECKLPTALHSWGSQTTECPCGCRSAGFSDALLTTKGVYAQLLRSAASPSPEVVWRHLHVLEVALLNGIPLDLTWGPSARLNLCAIGQMAAPMQSIWIAASVVRHLQALFTTEALLDPCQALNDLKHLVLRQSKELFRIDIPSAVLQPPLVDVQVTHDGMVSWKVKVPSTATVGQLILAECALHGFPKDDTFAVNRQDDQVPPDSLLCELGWIRIMFSQGNRALAPVDLPCESCPSAQPADDAEMSHVISLATQLDVPEPAQAIPETTTCTAPGVTGSADAAVVALMHLTPDQLMAMLPPLVADPVLCQAMRKNVLSLDSRMTLLHRQQFVWSDDEIWWHMRSISLPSDGPVTVLLDPLLSTSWCLAGNVDLVNDWISKRAPFQRIASVVLCQGHWTPCLWTIREATLEASMWDHNEADVDKLNPLHGLLCQALKLQQYATTCTRRGFGLTFCGAASIAFLQERLGCGSLPGDDDQLKYVATCLRTDFQLEHDEARLVPRPWCWGGAVFDLEAAVSSVLQQHGVPVDAAPTRAKLVIHSLGPEEVTQAVKGTAPWKTLKHLANQQADFATGFA